MEGGLEALSRLRTSLEIPCQDVLVFSFRLGMKRDLSHSTVLPSVLGLADGRHAKDLAVPCQPRPRPSDAGSRSTKQNRTAVHSTVLVRPVVLRSTPSALLRARLGRLEALVRSLGPLACCPPKAVSSSLRRFYKVARPKSRPPGSGGSRSEVLDTWLAERTVVCLSASPSQ